MSPRFRRCIQILRWNGSRFRLLTPAAALARTSRGFAEKARVLHVCAGTTETVALAMSLADDAAEQRPTHRV
jgi:hypothetical protein